MAKEVKKKATSKETQKQQIIKLFSENTLINIDDIVAGVGCSDKYAKEVMKNIWMEPEIQATPPLGLVSGTNLLRTRNKVSIVGFAPSSMRDVRHVWDDPDMEVWGINQLYMPGAFPEIVEKATRWFQIHHRSSYDQTVDRDITHHEWMSKQNTFPIYMQKQELDIPMSVPFPKEEILQHYRKYFTNTITWMIVLAHYEGFKEAHLYGIDMAQDCIAPETKVLTAGLEWIPASDIKVGQKVMGFDENTGAQTEGPHAYRQWHGATVEEANELTRPSYRVFFEDGTEIVASAGHQWLTYGEHAMKWKRTDELITPQHRHPTRIVKFVDTWEEDNSRDGGYLAAAFDGEGHLSQHQCKRHNGVQLGLGFSQRENAMSRRVESLLDDFGFKHEHNTVKGCNKYHVNGGKNELMRFLGQIRPARLLDKFDPDSMGSIKKKEAVAVVKTEFLGDQPVIGFKTSTKTFVAEGFASHNSEYAFERPSVEWAVGLFDGCPDRTIVIPEKSDICKSAFLYPFDETAPLKTKLAARRMELRQRLNAHSAEEQNNRDARMQCIGALDNTNHIEKSWLWNASRIEMPSTNIDLNKPNQEEG